MLKVLPSDLVVGVESALWSLLLSLTICVAAVSVFTAHPLLLLPVLVTILGKRCTRGFAFAISDNQERLFKHPLPPHHQPTNVSGLEQG